MGTVCSSIFNKSYVHYRFTDKVISHPVLDKLMVIQDDVTGNLVYGINIDLDNLALQDQALLERHQLLTHSNVLRFEGFKKITNQEYVVLYESFECTLEEEIQRRKAKNKPFTEQEILGILQNITSALTYFQNKDIYHGQVTSDTIVKKGDEYKLLDLVLFEKHSTTYQQALLTQDESKLRLLSPELKEALAQEIPDPTYKKYKQDIYSLGVIILDAMNLDIKAGYSTSDKFAQAIRLYSEFLIEVVTKMVQESELLRIDVATCNKIVENMYYGFTVTENSERGPFPSSRENPAERGSGIPAELEALERQSISPTKENYLVQSSVDNGSHVMFKTDLTMQKSQTENLESPQDGFIHQIQNPTPQNNFFNSIEFREGFSLQEKLPSVVNSFVPGLDLGIREEQNIGNEGYGQLPSRRYQNVKEVDLLRSSEDLGIATMSSVADNQYLKDLMKEYPMMSTAYTKGAYDSKMSTVYAADERVHTFGSTYRVTDENILSEKSKMTSPKQVELNLTAPTVTPFVNNEISRKPLATVQLADLQIEKNIYNGNHNFKNEKVPLVAASLNAENLITKETYGNSYSHFDPSDMESVNLREMRNKAKKRGQAVLISDSYQDKELRNLLSSAEGLENYKARPMQEISTKHYPIYKSPPQLRSENSQPNNIITIEDYRANENRISEYQEEYDGYDQVESRLPKGDYGMKGLSTMGSSSSGKFASALKYVNEMNETQRHKKHYRTKTMIPDLGGFSGKKGLGLSQDYSLGNLHLRSKGSISESIYKTSIDLRPSQMSSMYKARRAEAVGGRSMGYAIEYLRNDVKHSFFTDTDNFLEKRLAPHKRRNNSTIEALQQTIERIRGAGSTSNLKLSTLQSDYQEIGLMSQVMTGTIKKSLNLTLPKQERMMHSRHASEVYEDNSKYEGELQGDLRHGQGKLIFKDGRFYEGAWKLGRIDGYGILYSPSGSVMYEGEWKNNKYEGDGVIYNEQSYVLESDYINREFSKDERTWVKYEGEFNNDKWNGFGKLVFSNGDVIQGNFKMDKLHGKGSYNRSDGLIVAGEWQNNVLVRVF